MLTHHISIDAERQLVVKRYFGSDRGEADREWRALQLLAEHAPRLAPDPVSADLAGDPPTVTMSLLPGQPLGDQLITDDQVLALATAVGQLWQSVPVARVTAVRDETDVQARLVQDTGELLTTGHYRGGDDVVTSALERGADWLAGAAGLTQVLARTGQDWPGVPRVFGHGDPDLANYLWDAGLVRIVDFEESGVSDRAFELAMLVEHISAWRDAGFDSESFVEGFDLSRAEAGWLADWRRLAALHWLLRLRPGGPTAGTGPPGALRAQAHRLLALL